MEDAHVGRSAVDCDDRGDLGLLQATHVPGDIAERKGEDPAGSVYVNPIVGRAKAALAKHARRNHDPLAAIAAPGDQPALLEFFEIATDGFAAVPTRAQLRFIRSCENLVARFLFVERGASKFLDHKYILLRFLRPHNNDRADLHQIAPSLSDAALGLAGHLAFCRLTAELPIELTDFHHARGRDRIADAEQ